MEVGVLWDRCWLSSDCLLVQTTTAAKEMSLTNAICYKGREADNNMLCR